MSGTLPTPSRCDYLRGGGALVAGSLLAGCSGDGSNANSEKTSDKGTTDEGTSTGSGKTTTDGGPYSVSMAPMGDVEFDSVPERARCSFPSTRTWQSRSATATP